MPCVFPRRRPHQLRGYPCVGVGGGGEVGVGDAVDEDGEDGGGEGSVPSFRGGGGEEHHPLQRRRKGGRRKGGRKRGEEREEKKGRKKR